MALEQQQLLVMPCLQHLLYKGQAVKEQQQQKQQWVLHWEQQLVVSL
jgi:hypothetical protein